MNPERLQRCSKDRGSQPSATRRRSRVFGVAAYLHIAVQYAAWNLFAPVTIDGPAVVAESDESNNTWSWWNIVITVVDSDGDGIPDDWEVAHNLNPQDASDAARDDDGDGFTNLGYIAGTDPLNPARALRITAIREVGNNVELDFDSISGKME